MTYITNVQVTKTKPTGGSNTTNTQTVSYEQLKGIFYVEVSVSYKFNWPVGMLQ